MPAEVETMFYHGDVPWHGLGTKLDQVATAEEAIAAAQLDWEVEKYACYLRANGKFTRIQDRNVLARKSDKTAYNVVSDRYIPVQNAEAFRFFDQVVGNGDAKYHTAGALQNGGVIWILAQLTNNGNGTVGIKGEQVDKYLLLTNSHNGYFAMQMRFTPIRVVCMNTLSAAVGFSRSADTFYARHTTHIMSRVDAAKEILGLTKKFYTEWEEQAQRLASIQLPAGEMPKLLMAAFGTTNAEKMEDVWKPTLKEMEKIPVLMETGKGMDNPAIRGTKWAAYNAIVEYVDYNRQYRKKTDDARLYGAWFGTGNDIKQRAWKYLLQS